MQYFFTTFRFRVQESESELSSTAPKTFKTGFGRKWMNQKIANVIRVIIFKNNLLIHFHERLYLLYAQRY